MSIISSLFIIILCLSLYACNARHFGVVETDSSSQLHFVSKVEEKVKLNMDSIQRATNGDDSLTDKSHGGAISTQKPKKSKALLQNKKHNKGSENVGSSSDHVVLVKAKNIEESTRRRGRTILELGNHVKEEAIESKDINAVQEEVVEQDYAPPHRNPPSHNRKTLAI